MFHSHSKDLTLFDIRLKTRGHKNTVVVKGNELDVDNVLLDGHVKLLAKQDLHVKKIKLVLTGELMIDYYSKSKDGLSGGQVTERDCVLKVVWPNLLCSSKGELQYGDYGDLMIKYHKADHLARLSHDNSLTDLTALDSPEHGKRPAYGRTKSLPTLFKNADSSLIKIPRSGIDGTPYPLDQRERSESHSFLLPNGNYSMPFSVCLPGNVPESVEGLAIGQVRYKLECQIERGRFDRVLKKARHFRIVRTLHPANVNLYESIEYSNTWPGKIDFKVLIPRKGLAIGSTVPIKLLIVPLVKGLSFKSMSAEIVQHAFVTGIWGKSPGFETVAGKQKLKPDETTFNEDGWVVESKYQVPSSLAEVTQSCTLKNEFINVKHRVRVLIHIRNADGHVSELRANLPVLLHLSPNQGKVTTRHLEVDSTGHFTNNPSPDREDVIFSRGDAGTPQPEPEQEADSAPEELNSAPPIYNQHYNDIVFDISSPKSPMEQLRAQGHTPALPSGYFGIPIPSSDPSSLDLNALLKIPGYEEALEDASDEEDEPAPLYNVSRSASKSPLPFLSSSRSLSMPSMFAKDSLAPSRKKVLFSRREK